MGPIPDSSIRNEKFNGAKFAIIDALEEIPLTNYQRRIITDNLDSMEAEFNEANASPTSKLNKRDG